MGSPSPYGPTVVSIKAFLTLAEAMAFCDRNTKLNLFIQCELDGRYHVYNGG
mgnify:FL=1|jgi:hypothetical protein